MPSTTVPCISKMLNTSWWRFGFFHLCVEGFIDVHAIVLTVGKRLSSPFPDEASWWVGVDSAAEEDSLLLVEAATYIADGLVNGENRFI